MRRGRAHGATAPSSQLLDTYTPEMWLASGPSSGHSRLEREHTDPPPLEKREPMTSQLHAPHHQRYARRRNIGSNPAPHDPASDSARRALLDCIRSLSLLSLTLAAIWDRRSHILTHASCVAGQPHSTCSPVALDATQRPAAAPVLTPRKTTGSRDGGPKSSVVRTTSAKEAGPGLASGRGGAEYGTLHMGTLLRSDPRILLGSPSARHTRFYRLGPRSLECGYGPKSVRSAYAVTIR